MSINPILDLLYDGQGNLKTEITDRDLMKFYEEHIKPCMNVLLQINEYHENNPNPAKADSRNNLIHLWDNHRDGFMPFGDLVFLNDTECEHIHFPIIAQVYNYFKNQYNISDEDTNNRRQIAFCTKEYFFLRMALLYEVLPHVGQRLKSSIDSNQLRKKIEEIFTIFQQKVQPFNKPNSNYDTSVFALGGMNQGVFGSSVGTALDGSCFYPTFQFGSNNDGDAVKAVELLEGMFRSLINQVPLETVQTTPDDAINYLEYGGSDLSSADAKIDLFCAGVEATRIVRQIVTEQHSLMYSDDPHLQKIATLSNDSFDPDKLLAFLANTTENG